MPKKYEYKIKGTQQRCGYVHYTVGDIGDFWNTIEPLIDEKEKRGSTASSRYLSPEALAADMRRKSSFFNGTTYDEVVGLLRNGWKYGGDKIRAMIDTLKRDVKTEGLFIQNVRRRRCWGDDGDEIDIDRVRSGQLDQAWKTSARDAHGIQPVVTLVFDSAIMSGESENFLFWKGASAIAITEVLEEAGYSVEIIGYWHARQKSHFSTYTCKAKGSDEPLRIDALAAALCNVAVWRAFHLPAISAGVIPGDLGNGYGSRESVRHDDTSKWAIEADNPISLKTTTNERAARAEIFRVLRGVAAETLPEEM